MKSFDIVGYSGHSHVLIDIAHRNSIKVNGYYDLYKKEINPFKLKYLGNENNIENKNLFIAIGNNQIRMNLFNKLNSVNNLKFNIIDFNAVLSSNIKIGYNLFIGSGVIINYRSNIGNACIINSASIIEHHCKIGNFCHIAPGSVLCGNVILGNNVLVGANSTILPNINVGNNVQIGSGSVVTKNVPNNSLVYGNPAKIINK